jgi:radical SAM superfamily enzyme YgiQ (UPF0313 family)
VRALLISTYDLGRQPFGLASPAAWLREAGADVTCADLSRDALPDEAVRAADFIAFFLPMHTATRLALPFIDRVRSMNSTATLCAYGLYASLNAALLRERGVTHIVHGEFEERLRDLALQGSDLVSCTNVHFQTRVQKRTFVQETRSDPVARLDFRVPDRSTLPPLSRYATLQIGGDRRVTGYTEASRGCKHRCRHCPIVPVYDGRFRIVPVATVMSDVQAQVAAGARHITFGDPDFFNGIGHATAVLDAFAREHPGISYDVTIKVEHLLQYSHLLPRLRETGCAFVTTAVESIDDAVLARLEKGHTRDDFERVVSLFRALDLPLSPTFVAFTPWTTLESYCELLRAIDRLGLVDSVAPIQLAIRLLVTEGSRLLELPEMRGVCGRFDMRSLTYPWRHPDPRVDALQQRTAAAVGVRVNAPRRDVFVHVWRMAHDAAGGPLPEMRDLRPRTSVPYLNEPWYC